MADDDDDARGPLAWLSKRAGLVILVVIGVIVAARLMASWIKWLLIAVIVGAVLYLWSSRSRDDGERE